MVHEITVLLSDENPFQSYAVTIMICLIALVAVTIGNMFKKK